MFTREIWNYVNNLEGLRDFVDIVESHLVPKSEKEIRKRFEALAPIILAALKFAPKEFEKMKHKLSEDEIRRSFPGTIHLDIIERKKDEKHVAIRVEGKGSELFEQAMEDTIKDAERTKILYRSMLITLISSVEWFLSQILQGYINTYPDILETEEKTFSFNDLKDINNIKDARRILIDKKVENIMRGSFSDWISFFENTPKLSMSYLEENEPNLVECCERRNIIVHNGGVVNRIYLSRVSDKLTEGVKSGDEVDLTRDYLYKHIDLFEKCCILIACELWKNIEATDNKRAKVLRRVANQHLEKKRWSVAEGLYYFLMNDKKMQERDILVGKMSYWLCLKMQSRWDEIKSEVENADLTAKDRSFKLARFSLCEDREGFFKLFSVELKFKKANIDFYKSHPIFEFMRKDRRFNRLIKEFEAGIPQVISEENKTQKKRPVSRKSKTPTRKTATKSNKK